MIKSYCGEGGVGRRNALRGERVRRRAGKQWASEWWLTPVSVSSDCRREFKSVPPAARRESSAREQMRTSTDRESPEEERESAEEDEPCLRLFKALFCVIKHPFLARHPWLPRPSFPDPRTLLHWCRNPGAAPSTLPLRGARGLWPTVCDGSAAPGRVPQVALGRAPRRRGSYRPGGAGAVRRPTTPANGWVGPVPPPDVAGSGHPAGGGPSGGVPRGRRAPANSLSLSLSPPFPLTSLSLSPRPRSQVAAAGGP